MSDMLYTPLQIREVFHLEFLRWFGRKLTSESYVLKGGVNMRLFFRSIRYSEDMDIDVRGVNVDDLRDVVMQILVSRAFLDNMRSFGVEKVVPPDISKAKQTETTQRFKAHLLTGAGEDLFTKIEFSRRGLKGESVVEPVPAHLLRSYKMSPMLVPHYDVRSAVRQKVGALAQRPVVQPRDIFDLFVLSTQLDAQRSPLSISEATLKTAHNNLFTVEFPQFRDAVVAYFAHDDQKTYSSPEAWDEIKLKTANFMEELGHEKNT